MYGMLRRLVGAPGRGERLRPARDVLACERDGVAVLLDLRRGVYLGLDEVGTTIWQEVEQGSDVARIVERVGAEYEAPRETVERDTREFLRSLVNRRLAVRA